MFEETKTEEILPTKEAPRITQVTDETIDALSEIHAQLNEMEKNLFGGDPELHERPPIKCFEDAAVCINAMAKYAVDRVIRIKQRFGL